MPNRREEIIVGVAEDQDGWRLRLATLDDIDGLHSLASIPLVYRYLFDGAAPEREFIAGWIAQSLASAADTGVGMWLLGKSSARYAGCVELRPDLSARSAELTYMLDPEYWCQGLAVRMSWTAITQAFLSPQIDSVIAGADLPNTASFAVMNRLGMQFRKKVTYPLGCGAEYIIRRNDAGPTPRPALITFALTSTLDRQPIEPQWSLLHNTQFRRFSRERSVRYHRRWTLLGATIG
jgi:RimJ/RimL family protein N-acetyltransferase